MPGNVIYLIDAEWLGHWLDYAMKKKGAFHPGPITNSALLVPDSDKLLPNINTKTDFRKVNRVVWEYLWSRYEGGPVIAIKVPEGFDAKAYSSGSWFKKVDLNALIRVVRPSAKPLFEPENDQVINELHNDETISPASKLQEQRLHLEKLENIEQRSHQFKAKHTLALMKQVPNHYSAVCILSILYNRLHALGSVGSL
jgi:hypothetical protein